MCTKVWSLITMLNHDWKWTSQWPLVSIYVMSGVSNLRCSHSGHHWMDFGFQFLSIYLLTLTGRVYIWLQIGHPWCLSLFFYFFLSLLLFIFATAAIIFINRLMNEQLFSGRKDLFRENKVKWFLILSTKRFCSLSFSLSLFLSILYNI